MRFSLKSIILLGLLALATPAFSQLSFEIGVAPPARRHEVRVVRPSRTAVWQGGYHSYDAGSKHYNWVGGTWAEPPRAHAKWVEPQYKRKGKNYAFVAGRWK